MNSSKKYQIEIEKDRLIFRTALFRAEKGSVLHKGVYTKEFASMLFASAICVSVYMVMVNDEITFFHHLIVLSVFIITFLGSRKFLFKERSIEVVFDKPNNTLRITRPRLIKKKIEEMPLDNIRSVSAGSKKFIPQNPDGIKFVERISLQHGSPVPGLGDEEDFITLLLNLTDGSERIIYAEKIEGKIDGVSEIPLKEIRNFLAADLHRLKKS